MKRILIALTCIFILTGGFSLRISAQENQNDYIKTSVSGITTKKIEEVLPYIEKQDKNEIIKLIAALIDNAGSGFDNKSAPGLSDFCKSIYTDQNNNIFSEIEKNENISVIFLYRDMTLTDAAGGDQSIKIDFESLNSIYFHKNKVTNKWSNYLLDTKKVYVFYLDLEDKWYDVKEKQNKDKKLSNCNIEIKLKSSFFKQSFKDLVTLSKEVGALSGSDAKISEKFKCKLTMIELSPKKIKAPCDIVIKNKSFKEDFKVEIHEKNYASFQVGLANNKFRVNNFSIAGNNLTVKPDATQKEEWKSNLNALIELHPGRDIDNFRPIWKTILKKDEDLDKRKAGRWFSDNIFNRIGIYGGVKISKDPLASLHAGFNFAITKELYINLGWSWNNEVVPQVTEVGNITSLSDALKYAKRSYSSPEFSWGLSFSPSSVISMLGLKDKKEN
jgi:hypothetical protein